MRSSGWRTIVTILYPRSRKRAAMEMSQWCSCTKGHSASRARKSCPRRRKPRPVNNEERQPGSGGAGKGGQRQAARYDRQQHSSRQVLVDTTASSEGVDPPTSRSLPALSINNPTARTRLDTAHRHSLACDVAIMFPCSLSRWWPLMPATHAWSYPAARKAAGAPPPPPSASASRPSRSLRLTNVEVESDQLPNSAAVLALAAALAKQPLFEPTYLRWVRWRRERRVWNTQRSSACMRARRRGSHCDENFTRGHPKTNTQQGPRTKPQGWLHGPKAAGTTHKAGDSTVHMHGSLWSCCGSRLRSRRQNVVPPVLWTWRKTSRM
jgi:hypothetical protein